VVISPAEGWRTASTARSTAAHRSVAAATIRARTTSTAAREIVGSDVAWEAAAEASKPWLRRSSSGSTSTSAVSSIDWTSRQISPIRGVGWAAALNQSPTGPGGALFHNGIKGGEMSYGCIE
jgi:hypothetical protein